MNTHHLHDGRNDSAEEGIEQAGQSIRFRHEDVVFPFLFV
jgi:hypothetical protein